MQTLQPFYSISSFPQARFQIHELWPADVNLVQFVTARFVV